MLSPNVAGVVALRLTVLEHIHIYFILLSTFASTLTVHHCNFDLWSLRYEHFNYGVNAEVAIQTLHRTKKYEVSPYCAS